MQSNNTDQDVSNLTDTLSRQYWIKDNPIKLRIQQKYLQHYRYKLGIDRMISYEGTTEYLNNSLYFKMSDAEDQRSSLHIKNSFEKDNTGFEVRQRPLTSSIKSQGRNDKRAHTIQDAGGVRFNDQSLLQSLESEQDHLEQNRKLNMYTHTAPCIDKSSIPPRLIGDKIRVSSARNDSRLKLKVRNNNLFPRSNEALWTDEMIHKQRDHLKNLRDMIIQQEKKVKNRYSQDMAIKHTSFQDEINTQWLQQCESLEEQKIYDQVMRQIAQQQQNDRKTKLSSDQFRQNSFEKKYKYELLRQNLFQRQRSRTVMGSVDNQTKNKQMITRQYLNNYDTSRSLENAYRSSHNTPRSKYLKLYSWEQQNAKTKLKQPQNY